MATLLSINNYFYRRGGAEVVFLEQNRLFEEIGWQVVPFSMHHEKNLASPWQDWFVEEIEFGRNYSLFQKAVSAARIIYSFEARRKVRELVRQVQPAASHAHNVYHHISPAIFEVLHSLDVPVVLTLHDLKIACPAYKMLTHDGVCERCRDGAIWNVALHRCVKDSVALSSIILVEAAVHRVLGCYSKYVDRFVVPSRMYLEKLVEWGWPRERFVYVPNFVQVESFPQAGSPGKAFVYFGRLGPEKGLETFVRALALAGVSGYIIGSGPEEHKLRRLAEEVAAKVAFLGHLTGEALFRTVGAARGVVLPSEWYENAPMSVLEAYALRRPVIGADIGGIPELILEGETGTIFPSGDVAELATRLRMLADMPDNAILDMGNRGRKWVEQEFNATCYRDRLIELYRSLDIRC